jgi:hypothetical protein
MKRKLGDIIKLLKQFFGVDADIKQYRFFPKAVTVEVDSRKRIR